jgi:hypothetical protein
MKSIDTAIESFTTILKNPKIIIVFFGFLAFLLTIQFAVSIVMQPYIEKAVEDFISSPPIDIETATRFEIIEALFSSMLPTLLPYMILFFVVILLSYPFFNGILISLGKQAKNKKRVSIKNAFDEAKAKYLSLLGAYSIRAGAFAVIGITYLLLLASAINNASILSLAIVLFGILFFFVIGILLTLWLFEAETVVITENKKAIDAVKRSYEITSKRLLSLIATCFFFVILTFGILFVLILIAFPISLFDKFLATDLFGTIFAIFIELPVFSLIGSAGGILPVVFYYNYIPKKR